MSRLVAIIEGCLIADRSARWSVSNVLEALTMLRADAAIALSPSAVSGLSSLRTAVPPPPLPSSSLPSAVTYDVLDVIAALVDASVDLVTICAVADEIGPLTLTTLEVLRSCGVPPLKIIAARALLTARTSSTPVCVALHNTIELL